jgi:type II secretory pathway pseudopilin PulG
MLHDDGEIQVLIPEVRRRSRRRRLRFGLTFAIVTLGVALGVLAMLGVPPFSSAGGGAIPYLGDQQLTTATRAAVNSCQSAMTGYRQADGIPKSPGEAASVIAAYPTTAAALNNWSGAARGTFASYPESAPFDVCYLSGTWFQNPDMLMGTRTFHEAIYIIWTAKTPPGHPGVPRRYMTEMGGSLLHDTPPPAAHL